MQYLTKLLPHPVGSKAETSFQPIKAFSAVLYLPFNVKIASNSDKTVASVLISEAAAKPEVIPSSFASSFVVFKGSFEHNIKDADW